MISLSSLVSALTLVAALGCGLMAGVFFAFSTFVMKGLARLPPDNGIAAMQSINIAAVNSWFLAVFLGTSGACVFVIILALRRWSDPFAACLLAGGALFLAGGFLVTAVFNVPMNKALASLPATAPDRAVRWSRYLTHWTTWNHVRTLTSLAATALLICGWCGQRTHPAQPPPAGERPSAALEGPDLMRWKAEERIVRQ